VRDAVRHTVAQEVRERERAAMGPTAAASAPAPVGDTAPSTALVHLLQHLRTTVAAYVASRRAEGAAIERVLPEVKCLVREAASCEQWHDPMDALMAQVVRWTIDAYYEQQHREHVPPFT
jgi:hypothetical protein